jgi:hypothetical protein
VVSPLPPTPPGMATLLAPHDGSPCVRVLPHIGGVRVAGVMLQASPLRHQTSAPSLVGAAAPVLLEWGSACDGGDPRDPGVLSDVFVRVGGPNLDRQAVAVHTMVRLQHIRLCPLTFSLHKILCVYAVCVSEFLTR